jgi:hypothetical protein
MHTINALGRLALARGEVQLGRLGRVMLTLVLGMLGYVLVPASPGLHAAHVGKRHVV